MNTFRFALLIGILTCTLVSAQKVGYKNSIRVGADYTTLSTSNDIGIRYLLRYDRHLRNDRIMLEGTLGYLDALGSKLSSAGEHESRTRITGEITVFYDFLKSSSQALRFGVGPSVWHRQDKVLGVALYTPPSGPTNDLILYQVNDTSVGAHAALEYEYRVTPRIALAGRYGIAYLDITGPSSMIGLNLGYRF